MTLRRIAVAVLTVIGLGLVVTGQAQAFETSAKQAIVTDFQTGSVLFDKNADEAVHPASMSKLMTLYLVFDRLKSGQIKLTDTLAVSEAAWALNEGSTMFVGIGSKIQVEDLIRGIIVQSGNDACLVFAEGLAGSEEAFAKLMNEKAKEIGLTNSHFVNAHGLENPEHKMTARDLARLATRIVQDFPDYYHYFSEKTFVFNGITQGNRNPLLYTDTGADGLKTGHLSVSGYGITASALRDGRRIVMVLHGLESMQARADEARLVLDWAFRETENVLLAKANKPLEEAPVWLGQTATVPLVLHDDLLVTLPRGARDKMTAKAVFEGPVPAPIAEGQAIGKLIVQAGDQPPFEAPLYAGAAVAELDTFGRIIMAAKRLIGGGLN
jgi:D-alanyl-D-alanine carboxypeptidase (penicillin-binding protein 5/6)